MSFLVIMGLLLCIQTQGSSAVTRVFVQKGKDVFLEVPMSFALQKNDILTWKFNASNNLVRFFYFKAETVIHDDYVGRVSVTNYSVKLTNLQAADSGVYGARVSGATERTVVEYSVTVQDPASPVELNVIPVLSSSDSYIVNATCRTADSDISSSFRCINQTCNQDGGEQSKSTISGASLSIYLRNVSIFCNHSNQVSWTEDKKEIQDFCLQPAEHDQSYKYTAIVLGTVSVFVIAGAVAAFVYQRRQDDPKNTENTIYATPRGQATQTRDEMSPSDASCVSPTSTYSLVGLHSGPTETRDNPLPESVYSTVNKPAKIQKPARPCKNLQEL